MKDMTIVLNKKIINKETNKVRLVVNIDEAERKIFFVPADEPNAEPHAMAAASYDRRWKLYEESETETAEPETELLSLRPRLLSLRPRLLSLRPRLLSLRPRLLSLRPRLLSLRPMMSP